MKRATRRSPALPALILLGAALAPARALAGQEVTWATTGEASVPPPDAIAEGVRRLLFQESTDVRRGADLIRAWGVRALPLAPGATPDWSNVPPGSLIGAMQLEASLPDIRGVPIRPGVYTLRFALQPQDGDHMGVSPYRQFLVVAPAAEDRTVEPLGNDGAIALGKKTSGRSHPAVLSIDPPGVQTMPTGRVIKTELGHTALVVGVECTKDGAPAGTLAFGLVLVGLIEY
jgi:hypothetical protein